MYTTCTHLDVLPTLHIREHKAVCMDECSISTNRALVNLNAVPTDPVRGGGGGERITPPNIKKLRDRKPKRNKTTQEENILNSVGKNIKTSKKNEKKRKKSKVNLFL